MRKVNSVEEYISLYPEYKNELELLREIANSTGLEETLKWSIPTYTVEGKNVAGIGAFKSYVGLWFFNGSFLADKSKVLINAQEGKTKGMRQWRFEKIEDIDRDLIRDYIFEAIENEKKGLKIKPEKKALVIPDELDQALKSNAELMTAFEQFSDFKKKEFAEHIGEAKREATRLSRLEKCKPMILRGEGLHDKYR